MKASNLFVCFAVLATSSEITQFRAALLGGGARHRQLALGNRPGRGRGTRPATRARDKRRMRVRNHRPTESLSEAETMGDRLVHFQRSLRLHESFRTYLVYLIPYGTQ